MAQYYNIDDIIVEEEVRTFNPPYGFTWKFLIPDSSFYLIMQFYDSLSPLCSKRQQMELESLILVLKQTV